MKTNLSFLIILFVAVVTFINDIIIYFFKLDYLLSLIISTVAVIGLLVFLLKKKKIEIENYFCKWDLIFLGLYLVFTAIRIVIPDYMYDTINYHYYNQKYPFIEKINFDFLVAGGRVSDWVYPLGDRMNYIFRYLLGMRLGAILNYFSIVIIFYQIKKFLKKLAPNIKPAIQIICASFPISIPIIFRIVGTYYIDIYSAIFLLEIFYIGIMEKEIFNKKGMLYYWFLLAGIAVGIKISNLVLIIPVGINIIINNYKLFKNLKIRNYIILIAVFFLPFFAYGINNFVQMGNFFYPFMGGEKYYNVNNWNDPEFGIPNFWYSFIWPIIVTFFPEKGHNEQYLIELIWCFGYAFLIVNMFIKVFEKNNKSNLFRLEILTFFSCILWANFMNGYCRYAIIISILFAIDLTANFSMNYNDKIILNKIFYGLQYFVVITIFIITLFGTKSELVFYSMKISDSEFKKLFKDKNYTIHINGVWGSVGDTGGLVSLVREEDTPIYNINSFNVKASPILYNKYKEIFKDKDIYVITTNFFREKEEVFELLNKENFVVIEKIAEYQYIDVPYMICFDKWEIYKVKYLGNT